MNGTIRTSEPDQALLCRHTSSMQDERAYGPLLPMSRDLRRVRAALNPTHATESRASAWVASLCVPLFIGGALVIGSIFA